MIRGRKEKDKDKENDRPLVIADIAMPRDVDPAVRNVKGVFLYDLDDLENVPDHNAGERDLAFAAAQRFCSPRHKAFASS